MITILLFANLREEVGSERLVIIEKREMNVQQLKKWLKDNYQLQTLDKVMVAINEEFVTDEEIVKAWRYRSVYPACKWRLIFSI